MFLRVFQCCLLLFVAGIAGAQNISVAYDALAQLHLAPDSSAQIVIGQISITGNKKTKPYVILREIHLRSGDSVKLSQLNDEIQQVQQQVYNTSLFLSVNVSVSAGPQQTVDVQIAVKERWYIFPIPNFHLLDRNVNEWLQKYHGDLSRIAYGVKFSHYNLTGRRDMLRLTFLNGFNQNASFTYFRPVSEKSLNNGFSFTGGYVRSREFIYRINYDNKPLLFNNGAFSRRNIYAGIGYSFRKKVTGTHLFNLTYNHLSVVDSLVDAQYNPNYFSDAVNSKGYLDLSYTYQYVNTNNVNYPLKGHTGTFRILKRGFGWSGGINMLFLEGSYNSYWALGKNWFASTQAAAKTTLPSRQSYINQRALGYSDVNLRGLELYVVDGVAFGLMRNTLKRKLFSVNIPNIFFRRSEKYHSIPFTVFAKTYFDLGAVYNQPPFQTFLNNRLLYSGGWGIDILSIYDVNLRIEYSLNQLGKNGLFLQTHIDL